MKIIQDEIGIEVTATLFWTDSKICLSWLNTCEKLTAYVGSRVTKIKENGHGPAMWRWIPSCLNVADLATKSFKFENLTVWLKGPEFLYQDRSAWPQESCNTLSEEDLVCFQKEVEAEYFIGLQALNQNCDDLPDISRFSDFNRLIRTTAYYLKMKKMLALPREDKPKFLKIDIHDMTEARIMWYKRVQRDSFSDDIVSLKATGFVRRSSKLYKFSPFICEDVIRMKGRIQDEHTPFEVNNPVLLPNNHEFTKLLIRTFHIANGHQGIETVINNLNNRYRILKCRSQVKKVSRECVRCQELRGKPNVTQMGNLPSERTTPFVYPFTNTGIDYFGPLFVKVRRNLEKRWIVLFTCLTSRAIHLEVVPSLDTNSCILAIRCFMAIRGMPRKIKTDNGTNFTGANRELNKLYGELDQKRIEESLSVKGVEWSFIPPGAPHFGGCWERLVRSVKTGLSAMLKERHPSDLVLRSTLCEVMNIINNRPLTHVSDNPQDPEPLTPNMLLLGRNNFMQFDHQFDEKDLTCRAIYKHAQVFADRFWRRWLVAYRPELIKRTKWYDNRKYHNFKQGDLVLIIDENLNRGSWPKGIIEQVFHGPDGNVRTVVVRTARSSYTRPISKIVLLQPNLSVAPEDVTDT
ncbi:uncharacterized protein LOC129739122 [Uranotaenia lowii]|uniref:uncharacterized protein LOC129739122 n=1 Tax=Uranotaenia lowii TaxID=190385 RepID=UPI00247A835E|nr:uncharacterized protein LOC129739122 [Uranotaenia lowii]